MRRRIEFTVLWVAMLLVVSWGSSVVWERRDALPVPVVIMIFVLIASTVLVFLRLGDGK